MISIKFGWNGPNGSGEEDNNVKSYGNDDEMYEQGTNFDQKTSQYSPPPLPFLLNHPTFRKILDPRVFFRKCNKQ